MMEIGDVLLVTGKRITSKLLVWSQKLLYAKAQSSHVEFSMGDGVFLHATKGKRVIFTTLLKELEETKENWRVIRFKNLTPQQKSELQLNAYYFLAQDYNPNYLKPDKIDSSFCSELVHRIYFRTGINIFPRPKLKTISPANFDKIADENNDWVDVTSEYRKMLNFPDFSFILNTALQFHIYAYGRSLSRRRNQRIMAELAKSILSVEGKASVDEAVNRANQQRQFNYWTDDL